MQRFLEKSKKKTVSKDEEDERPGAKIEEKLKKKVTTLMKQQKLRAARQMVNVHDGSKPWGQNIKAKVCTVFVVSGERLMITGLHAF